MKQIRNRKKDPQDPRINEVPDNEPDIEPEDDEQDPEIDFDPKLGR